MYHSPRNSVEGYYKVLEDKGFTKDKMGCDVKVSDEFVNVQMEHLNIEVCKDLVEADGILVLSHVKGHPCAGFGGAIKNLGMGGVTKKSKKDIHVGAKPIVNDKCVACGVCKNVCPANAIEIKEISEVDLDKCWGCSLCIMKCPHEAMTPKVELFDTLLAEGAAAVVKSVKKTYYINVLKNIAKWCDCFDITSDKISEDVGILFSEDVVEIDRKSLDLIKEKNGKDVFLEHNNHDPYLQVNAMEQFLK